jgi:hypothetical protein
MSDMMGRMINPRTVLRSATSSPIVAVRLKNRACVTACGI